MPYPYRTTTRTTIIVSISLATALLGACASVTPLTQIESFAESSVQLSGEVDALIDEYNANNLEVALDIAARTHINGRPALQELSRGSLSQIEVVFTPELRKKIGLVRANAALNQYSNAVLELAQAGDRAGISSAAVELAGSLKKMNGSYADLKDEDDAELVSDERIGTIAAVISAIGSAIAECLEATRLHDGQPRGAHGLRHGRHGRPRCQETIEGLNDVRGCNRGGDNFIGFNVGVPC